MKSTPGSRIGSFFVRLLLTFLICFVILVLAILSAIPYGGGGEFLQLIPVAGIVGIIWSLMAFVPLDDEPVGDSPEKSNNNPDDMPPS